MINPGVLPAVLAGRAANGNERDRGRVVHGVLVGQDDARRRRIGAYARALCGKTHGARSAGWSVCDAREALTCAACIKAALLLEPVRPVIQHVRSHGYGASQMRSPAFAPGVDPGHGGEMDAPDFLPRGGLCLMADEWATQRYGRPHFIASGFVNRMDLRR